MSDILSEKRNHCVKHRERNYNAVVMAAIRVQVRRFNENSTNLKLHLGRNEKRTHLRKEHKGIYVFFAS